MNLETKITIYKFTPQVFTLTPKYSFPINFHQRKIIFLCQSNRQIVRFSRIDILDQGVIEVHKAKSLRVIGKRI